MVVQTLQSLNGNHLLPEVQFKLTTGMCLHRSTLLYTFLNVQSKLLGWTFFYAQNPAIYVTADTWWHGHPIFNLTAGQKMFRAVWIPWPRLQGVVVHCKSHPALYLGLTTFTVHFLNWC
ncbi:MAG: hypothetical protein CMC75_08755 [Flavobacteriaceae bacterium]|nr:hypothetical protein [Flavobacteriaceae bacterium]